MKTKIAYALAISLLMLSTTPALAGDLEGKTGPATKTTVTKKKYAKTKHCELQDVANKCCETERSGIKCIDELITVIQDAKTSRKKKVKDEALDKALSVLQKLKSNSEATVCAMQTIQQRNKLLKGKVQKIKKELGVVESMFSTPVSEPFMSGPYF